MPERSRLLLESAARLHDIGWRSGKKGHTARSARIILSDNQLPFDIAERGIIALAAFAHRGKVRFQSCGIYRLLSPEEQQVSFMIASILRIADGLDCRHNGIVRAITCHIDGQEIILQITGAGNTGPEKETAVRKAKLFIRLFGHSIHIR
jgi:exopolyphosphatase/guanosine-5'-triphosphate,3'-diphosphate pyrophosphatase